MEKAIKTIVLENTTDNHSKIWIGELYSDKIITRWGRIGYELSCKEFLGEDEEFFNKKVKEKNKKGYVLIADEE